MFNNWLREKLINQLELFDANLCFNLTVLSSYYIKLRLYNPFKLYIEIINMTGNHSNYD